MTKQTKINFRLTNKILISSRRRQRQGHGQEARPAGHRDHVLRGGARPEHSWRPRRGYGLQANPGSNPLKHIYLIINYYS